MRMKRPFFNRSFTTAESLHTRRCLLSKEAGFRKCTHCRCTKPSGFPYFPTGHSKTHLNQSKSSLSVLSDASKKAILKTNRRKSRVKAEQH